MTLVSLFAITALMAVVALRLLGVIRPLGTSSANVRRSQKRTSRHSHPRLVTGRGPSRRALRRALHLLRTRSSVLKNPKLGGLSLLLAQSRELERRTESALRSMAEFSQRLLSTDREARSVMADRVASMSEGRLNKSINRLRGSIGFEMSPILKARTERRRMRRSARSVLKASLRREVEQMKVVEAFNASVKRFAESTHEESTSEWALTCAALWEGSAANPRNQRGRTNARCIEGSRAFESSGRARRRARAQRHNLRLLKGAELPKTARERAIENGAICPSSDNEPGELPWALERQVLINCGIIRPAVEIFYSGSVALAEAC